MTKVEWSCLECKHFHSISKKQVPTCGAFSKGIPFAIISGEYDHRKPYKGDGGIVFEREEK